MRLKKLQVSGFKSFVDSTDIRLPANLVAVVGPNGCGKSNIIDAVRWVMGETSAKMLRGDSMTDVIFNGSASRKAVGKATVELLFDNSDHTAGSNFARFTEISVKRTLSRDGTSDYFINRIKTRRKDVLDLFRGTGLGPRSYSIIEQGMVSRIIEAHPEDLRMFVEEAAGTSKYKERRRETETRIAHTRENLNRVNDIREQLDKQLRRLKRQASAAKRYKVLKDEQRLVNQQLLLLRVVALDEKLEEQDRLSAQHKNQLEVAVVAQRKCEADIEKLRQVQSESQEQHNQVQQEQYRLGAEITNTEQRIEHLNDTQQQRADEIQRLQSDQAQQQQQLASDTAQLSQLQDQQTEFATQIEQLQQRRHLVEVKEADAEVDLENWQAEWDTFNEQSQNLTRQQEVQQSRITQLQQQHKRSTEQIGRLEQERAATQQILAEVDIDAARAKVTQHDQICEQREQEFQQAEDALQTLQQTIQHKRDDNAELRAQQHRAQSRLASLRQIQTAALGGDDTALQNWLKDNKLAEQPKLAERIRVTDGWQPAVDRVLDGFLGAVCVVELPQGELPNRPDCAFTLVADATDSATASTSGARGVSLLDKVATGETDLSAFLGRVYATESLSEAVAMQSTLGERECVVTRDGVLLGRNWISFASQSQLETGVLVREEEINQLQDRVQQIEKQSAAIDKEIAQLETQQQSHLQKGQQQRMALDQLRSAKTEMHSELGREETRYYEAEQRLATLSNELNNLRTHAQEDANGINEAQGWLQDATKQRTELGAKHDTLVQQKARYQTTAAHHKEELREASEQAHQQALQKQGMEAKLDSTSERIARIEVQLQGVNLRLAQINNGEAEANDPIADLQTELQRMLDCQMATDKRLSEASTALGELDARMKNLATQRSSQVDAVKAAQDILHQHDLDRQKTMVYRDTHVEQLDSPEYESHSKAEIPRRANIAEWEGKRKDLQGKIDRYGAVNLVAIEEFDEENERKEYLDKQHADLTEALDTLRSVMQKIDRETRTKFKQTFDQLNVGFKDFFPQLFGGGKVELQLTSDDFLTTGVTVIARPPGKRNSHIHLLSGGEKALTAVALLFALFKLNPAPFCMLDEVDASLDDANVERYCQTLKNLVKVSQMIVITHNKITMEAADILVGVTMKEPGVSRLVSVDIAQATALVGQ